MRGRVLDDAARLGLAGGERPGADLLVAGRPRPREVAVEIDGVIAEEVRGRDALAVEVLDVALGVDLVERPVVLEGALDEQARELAGLDQLAARIAHPHRARLAVAVDVAQDPAGLAALDAVIARHRAHRAAELQHGLGAVGRDPRHHEEHDLAQALEDRRRQGERLGIGVEAQRVLGDRQGDARSGELGGVQVAVDPRRRPDALGLGADRHEPDVAALRGPGERADPAQRRERLGPRVELRGQLFVVEVSVAKAQREIGEHWHAGRRYNDYSGSTGIARSILGSSSRLAIGEPNQHRRAHVGEAPRFDRSDRDGERAVVDPADDPEPGVHRHARGLDHQIGEVADVDLDEAALAGEHDAVMQHAALDEQDVAHLAGEHLGPARARVALLRELAEAEQEQPRIVDLAGEDALRGDDAIEEPERVQIDGAFILGPGLAHPPRARHVRRAAQKHVLGRAALEPVADGHRDLGGAGELAEPAVTVPQDAVAGQPVDRVEVEVAALERRHQRELVTDPDARDGVEILGHDDVDLAARIERDEQQATRRQPLLAELLEPEDERGGIPVVVDTGREHRRST